MRFYNENHPSGKDVIAFTERRMEDLIKFPPIPRHWGRAKLNAHYLIRNFETGRGEHPVLEAIYDYPNLKIGIKFYGYMFRVGDNVRLRGSKLIGRIKGVDAVVRENKIAYPAVKVLADNQEETWNCFYIELVT